MGELPAHIIEHLNSADERQERAVLDAVIKARYEERDRFAAEHRECVRAVKLMRLLRYSAAHDWYVVTRLDLAEAGIHPSELQASTRIGSGNQSTEAKPAEGTRKRVGALAPIRRSCQPQQKCFGLCCRT